MEPISSSPLASKKFIAFLVSEITWKIVILSALFLFNREASNPDFWGWWFLIASTLISGFITVGYIGGQAYLDRYVRVAELVSHAGESLLPDMEAPR